MIALLTATSDWHHHGWFWLWPLTWLLALLVVARLLFWRRRSGWVTGCGANQPADPRKILAERYARGEIDHDEYRERLGHLQA